MWTDAFNRIRSRLAPSGAPRSEPPGLSGLTPAEIEERKALHDTLRDDLFKRQLSNAENLDKAILTLSSAGLGLSLSFLKEFLSSARPAAAWLLYWSWYLFGAAIVSTVLSFISSQRGITKRLEQNWRYYQAGDDAVPSERNFFGDLTDWLACLAASAFILAVVSTIIFVRVNVERRTAMSQVEKIVKPDGLERGAPVPKTQPVPATPQETTLTPASKVRDGAPVPGVQRIPPAPGISTSTTATSSAPHTTTPPENPVVGPGNAPKPRP
jgi:hypothetical protein